MSKKKLLIQENSSYRKLQSNYDTQLRTSERSPQHSRLENMVGVSVVQVEPKGFTSVEVVIPTGRTEKGSRMTHTLELTGRQARQVYETLRKFYETRDSKK